VSVGHAFEDDSFEIFPEVSHRTRTTAALVRGQVDSSNFPVSAPPAQRGRHNTKKGAGFLRFEQGAWREGQRFVSHDAATIWRHAQRE
jgi:hypothetical protein